MEECMRFEEINQDTPRLVAEYTATPQERFSFGVVGAMPILSLVGFVIRVQSEVWFKTPEPCPHKALVIAWNEKKRSFDYFLHKDIPLDALVGFMETIKLNLMQFQAQNLAGRSQKRGNVVDLSGKPYLGG